MGEPSSPDIAVDPNTDGTFAVQVSAGNKRHHYCVSVPPGLVDRLGNPSVDPGQLVRESFVFLLEREPATAIQSSFSLDVISRYFPEYEATMARRMA